MAEFINPTRQIVEVGANVLFTDTVIEPCCKVRHRRGSGIFTLKAGKFVISYGSEVAIPTGETVSPILLAVSLNGETLQSGTMSAVPAAVEDLWSVARTTEIEVPCNCCYTLSVRNIGTTPIAVDDANLVTIREVQ